MHSKHNSLLSMTLPSSEVMQQGSSSSSRRIGRRVSFSDKPPLIVEVGLRQDELFYMDTDYKAFKESARAELLAIMATNPQLSLKEMLTLMYQPTADDLSNCDSSHSTVKLENQFNETYNSQKVPSKIRRSLSGIIKNKIRSLASGIYFLGGKSTAGNDDPGRISVL